MNKHLYRGSPLSLAFSGVLGRMGVVIARRARTAGRNGGLFPILFLICSPAMLFAKNANAQDYYWTVGYDIDIASSPEETCLLNMKRNEAANAPYLRNSKCLYGVGFPAEAPKQFSYKYSFDSYSGRNVYQGTHTGFITIYRKGTSCPLDTIYNGTLGTCSNDAQKGAPPENSCAGNPINVALGNKFQTEYDYQASGNSTLSFTRSYNSLDGIWRHRYSAYLRLAGTTYIALVMADGRESFFTVSGTNVTASPTELGKLVKLTDGWQYTAKSNERFSFDATGRLTRWSNTAGMEQQLSYAGGTITVTDTLGHSLSFTEDAKHQPLSLTADGLQISYSYNANKRLTQLTRTQAGQTEQRSFHYEDTRNVDWLTGITDERGVRYATWTYDDKGRATSSEHASGIEHTDVAYNADGSSTVTNALGKKATYRFQAIDGIKRVSAIEGEPSANCPMSNSTFTYDTRGLLKTKTDNKGFVTTYDYNDRGLEITRTEASGTPQARTTATTWHTTLNLPLTVTEPGRLTTYTYDTQGRQLSQTSTAL